MSIPARGFVVVLAMIASLASPVLAARGHGRDPAPAGPPTLVVKWNQTLLECIRVQRLGPPMTARAIGMTYTAGFDAWACYDDVAVPTRPQPDFRRPAAERTDANREKAFSYAVYRSIVDLFPAGRDLARAQMVALGYDPDDAVMTPSTAQGVGNVCAQNLLTFRHGDGSNQLGDLHAGAYSDYTGYTPVNTLDQINDPNRWQPLRFSDGAGGFVAPGYIGAHWGEVTPFALPTGDALRPAPPAMYPSRAYERQSLEIMQLTENIDDRGKVIAEYWADGPRSELPPGHWTLFAEFVSSRDHHTFGDDVKLFFMLGNAVMDAGISVWEAKRWYDYARPITAIRFLKSGQKVKTYIPFVGRGEVDGKDWLPYQPATFITPPFAEYPSGHSGFSAASAEVLQRFTGSDEFGGEVTMPAGSSKVEPGFAPSRPVTLHWNTFSDAADEAGYSRRLGGIHFEAGDLASRRMGRQVGALVWAKAMEYINGRTGAVAALGDADLVEASIGGEPVADAARITVGPNPSAGRVTLSFAVALESQVRVSVIDLQGREVANLADAPFAAGRHTLAWDGSREAPGVYFVRVRRGDVSTTTRVLIAR